MSEITRDYYKNKNLARLNAIKKHVPHEMQTMPNWCAHKSYLNKEEGKRKKIVINCDTGRWASPTDSTTWTTFENALEYARRNNCEGVTFAVHNSGLIAIDIDHCFDTNGNNANATANDVMGLAQNCFTEKSMSGTGLHIFVKGSLGSIKNINNAIGLEAYDKAKFISLTGEVTSSTSVHLVECPSLLKEYLARNLGTKTVSQHRATPKQSLSDDDIIACIRRSVKGSQFDQLYAGYVINGNHSDTDMQLLNILAFFTDCNADQVTRIFRSSGLYRPEKEKYLQYSVEKAISTLHKRPTKLNQPSRTSQEQK